MAHKLKISSAVVIVLVLAACGGERRQATVQPPPAPAPVAQAVAPQEKKPEQTVVPAPAPAKPVPSRAAGPDAIALLVNHAEILYAAGMKEYQAGNMDNARQDFDKALALLLESNYRIADDERLSNEFDKLVENIHAVEVATVERGDTLSDKKYVPAPIESLSNLTFPVDPNVKQRVQEQLSTVHSDLPLVSNDLVDGVITYFQGRGHGYMERVLANVGLYQSIISEALRKEGLPQDLIYLAGAESSYNPVAVSRARCVGIWQFSLGTGVLYGLKKNRWVDERSDPGKSTEAAARHLHDLFQTFGDWYLAMAAYDSGALTVQRAIEKTGYADFWKLRELGALPKETQNYVPIFLATAIVAKDPKAYGFDVQPLTPPEVDRVPVSSPTDLRLIAQLIGHPVDELIKLNPSLLRWTTPDNAPDYVLNLPAGTGETFTQAIAQIPEDKRVWWRVHTVGGGETYLSIAKKYRVTKAALLRANDLESDDDLAEGTRLVVPLPTGRESSLARVRERGPRRLMRYRIRPGDTLELIADRYDVTPYELRQWNKLQSSKLIAGKTLKVYVSGGRSASSRRTVRRKATPSAKTRSSTFSRKKSASAKNASAKGSASASR
ncbi:MAG: LysM peptidoglycan-binding domain-containing protein [Deltaproteobacteria bacterium]